MVEVAAGLSPHRRIRVDHNVIARRQSSLLRQVAQGLRIMRWYALLGAVFIGVMLWIDVFFLPGNEGGSVFFAILAAFAFTLLLTLCIRLASLFRSGVRHTSHSSQLERQDDAALRSLRCSSDSPQAIARGGVNQDMGNLVDVSPKPARPRVGTRRRPF
jgi:hypothetical protein